ncbi:MAG: InlB B-repeat-containing protein [Firmicutes bacterium]|nr:InlB B-repeat-containing protein [Bacillota bacterium]
MKRLTILMMVLISFLLIGCDKSSTTTESTSSTLSTTTTTSVSGTESTSTSELVTSTTSLEVTLTFNSNGGTSVSSILATYNVSLNMPTDPTKSGYIFSGWFYDDDTFTIPLDSMLSLEDFEDDSLTVYAKWVEEVVDNHLATEVLSIHSSIYGNTNGNLNNQGLAVFDTVHLLHYYSLGSSVYSYNPDTEDTTVLFSLISGGRATFLNLDGQVLYFIDSTTGFLMSYHLENHVFTTISETENIYASRTQSWVNIVYPFEMYSQSYIGLQRYITTSGSFSSIGSYGLENFNINGTRVYYNPIGTVNLSVMNYDGMGKSTIVYLEDQNVDIIHEALLYRVSYDYVAYFGLILTVDDQMGLYTYNSVDGLVKIMDALGGNLHSLNFDGENLYAISGTSASIYKIDLDTMVSTQFMALQGNDTYLQVINHWFYVGTFGNTSLYRINPVTNEIETLG